MAPLLEMLSGLLSKFHLYAYTTWVYFAFKPPGKGDGPSGSGSSASRLPESALHKVGLVVNG